ncbi:SEP-domain-containing protein [Mucor ambiguus]|uniref:SEP-domain-containing protein n=1 Tax=Mucor ambiguus TaxID=91626 RepID=A0A0C9MTP2_9FUNG|nr:SEP-domain-containing protein [Mucor ambiguus]
MSDHSDLLNQFVNMTGTEVAQAQFYLEASNWDLEVRGCYFDSAVNVTQSIIIKMAVSQFFDNAGGADKQPFQEAQEQQQSSEPFAPRSNVSSGSATPTKRKAAAAGSSKIRTLSDINSSGQNNDSDDDEHENLYAGGEKSGMAVQGPNKRGGASGSNDNSLVDQILKKAAEGGAPAEEEQTQSQKKPTYYTGSGYRLGSEDEPSTLAQPATSASPAENDDEDDLEPVTRHLTFWRNGFSVDDGPLYLFSDPANQEMLTAINSGRAPLHLLNVRHGQPVEVRVVKRIDEDYTPPPKAPPKPFEGAGNRLGSPAAYTAPSPAPGAFPTSSNATAPTVDESQPTTSIQIRLGDGSKVIAKLNHTHTIADVRQYIESTHPTSRPYILQTTFPVKELQDNNQSIKEAGLLNSVIVQRYQ